MSDKKMAALELAIIGTSFFIAPLSHAATESEAPAINWDAGISIDVVRDAGAQLPKADEKGAWNETRVISSAADQPKFAQGPVQLDQPQETRPTSPAGPMTLAQGPGRSNQLEYWDHRGVHCEKNGYCFDRFGFEIPNYFQHWKPRPRRERCNSGREEFPDDGYRWPSDDRGFRITR